MSQKYIVKPEIEADIKQTIFELFENGCPICISDDGNIEVGAYDLPDEYRKKILSSLYKYESKDVAWSVNPEIPFILNMIDNLPKGTRVYWVHDFWRTTKIWVVDNLELAQDCVKHIINYIFSVGPRYHDEIKRKIYVRKERLSRLQDENSNGSNSEILELKKEIDKLEDCLEKEISDFEDYINNDYAIEVLISGEDNSARLNEHIRLGYESAERERWKSQKIIFNPKLRISRETGR